jgi:uncharacterized protein YndB with AHSA1/START domain
MTVSVVAAGPRKVSRTVEVPTPAEDLFALLANPRRHGELDGSGTVLDAVSGPDRLKAGDKFSVKMKQRGVPYRITSRVTELRDGRLIEWQHPLGHRWRWELAPTADGATRVTETFDYSHVNGLKAKVLELTGVPKQNAAGIEATLTQLATRA